MFRRIVLPSVVLETCLLLVCSSVSAGDLRHEPVIPNLPAVPTQSVSTIPANGDVNPYGVAFVPMSFPNDGAIKPGDILVSNFNNSSNEQGTGTTIVRITPNSETSVFFRGSPGLGLTTALGVLKNGFVLVGNVPTTDGTCGTAQQGSLLVIDRHGRQVGTLASPSLLDGPWDLTIRDEGDNAQVYVSNVLSGTVTRLDIKVAESRSGSNSVSVQQATQIASGYLHRCDPAALVVGPTGLAFDADHDLLYVASTGDNKIFAIANPDKPGTRTGTGIVVYRDEVHLHGPLGLVLCPNGDLITANGDAVNPDANQPSEMVEFMPEGSFVAQRPVNSTGLGGAFEIALSVAGGGIHLAAVDDIANALDVWIVE